MPIKKRNKVSAEFSMSSLTDIIFLLLIFFMLTSTLVNIPSFELPKSDVKTVAPTSIVVSVERSGAYTLNGETVPKRALLKAIGAEVLKVKNRDEATVTIVAEVGVPFERVVDLMDISRSLRAKAILATQPTDQ
jgi:biopolymer transport protein ExbD